MQNYIWMAIIAWNVLDKKIWFLWIFGSKQNLPAKSDYHNWMRIPGSIPNRLNGVKKIVKIPTLILDWAQTYYLMPKIWQFCLATYSVRDLGRVLNQFTKVILSYRVKYFLSSYVIVNFMASVIRKIALQKNRQMYFSLVCNVFNYNDVIKKTAK